MRYISLAKYYVILWFLYMQPTSPTANFYNAMYHIKVLSVTTIIL